MVKVLVVGCGSIGKRHARLLGERPEVEVWVCDALASNLEAAVEQAPRAKPYSDYQQALADRPDAVFVCTPNHLHAPMAIAALQAGCDVLCEKPLADTVGNAEAIAEAARTAQGMLQVGYSLRSHAGLRRVQELVATGDCGTLVGGRAMVGTYFTLMCATTPYRMTEQNALISDYTHLLDYLRLFFGDLQRVSAESATLGELEMRPQPNLFSLLLKYTSGAVAQCHLDYIQHPQRHTLELYGDRQTIVYDFQIGQLQVFDRDKAGCYTELVTVGRDDIYRVQIEEFLTRRVTTRVPLVSAEDGVAALKTAHAAVEAARTGRAINFKD
jgi:predicted dehydrogenase